MRASLIAFRSQCLPRVTYSHTVQIGSPSANPQRSQVMAVARIDPATYGVLSQEPLSFCMRRLLKVLTFGKQVLSKFPLFRLKLWPGLLSSLFESYGRSHWKLLAGPVALECCCSLALLRPPAERPPVGPGLGGSDSGRLQYGGLCLRLWLPEPLHCSMLLTL